MEIRDLSFRYAEAPVLNNITTGIEKGRVTTIIGANGCGKSTLFNLMTKNLRPLGGGIYIDNRNIKAIPLKEFAKTVAIVHQYNTAPRDATVKDIVTYGRTPYTSLFRHIGAEDEEVIEWAMGITNIYELRDQPISLLSGGEKQRVWIAMALAQKTEYLLLDEPTTHLDIKYQIQILDLVQMLNTEFNMTIVMILHDINQAVHYSDTIIGMGCGEIIFQGAAEKIISSKNLYDIYQVELNVIDYFNNKYVLPMAAGYNKWGSFSPAVSGT